MIILLFKRKILLLLGFSIFLIGLVLMVNVSSYGFDISRYKEQVNFSLMFLAGFTFIYCVSILKSDRVKYLLIALISVLFTFRFYTIFDYGKQYSSRLVEMKKLIDQTQKIEGTKFIVDYDDLEHDANWSYPIETLVFSSIHFNKCVSIATDDDFYYLKNNEKIKPNEYLFRRWEIYDISHLNQKYFSLDSSKYVVLEN